MKRRNFLALVAAIVPVSWLRTKASPEPVVIGVDVMDGKIVTCCTHDGLTLHRHRGVIRKGQVEITASVQLKAGTAVYWDHGSA